MLFYSNDEKDKIKNKWYNVFVLNCDKCNHTGYIKQDDDNKQCDCLKEAIKYYRLETSNIPMQGVKILKEDVQKYVKYDFDLYFNIVLNEVFNIKDIYLYDLPFDVNNNIISYIAKELIFKEHKLTKQKITVKYAVYDDLIQLSLSSNNYNGKDKLMNIINNTDVLFINNVGQETGFGSSTKHNVKLLHSILQKRKNQLKSTIISSKLYIGDIERAYNKDILEILKSYDMIKKQIEMVNNYE